MSVPGNGSETPKASWKRWLSIPAVLIIAVPLAIAAVLSTDFADNYLRRTVTERLAQAVGGPVELKVLHFNPWRLTVSLEDLTIHGREPAGTPPLFHADRLDIALHVDSYWGRKISLRSVDLIHPSVNVRFEQDGASNIPALSALPATAPANGWRQRIFALAVGRVRLDGGELLWNDVRVPLVAEGGNLDFSVDSAVADGQPVYVGQFQWGQMQFAANRYLPFPSDLQGRFTLGSDSLTVPQLVWTLPHASFDTQISMTNFAHPEWAFRYRGGFDFENLRTILRQPNSPNGRVDFNGNARWANDKLALNGTYSATQIATNYQWFHTGGIESRGSYHGDQNGLEIPDFSARVLGGQMTARVQIDFPAAQFRVDSHMQGMDLITLFAALNNPNLPISPLHWDGTADLQAVTTWTGPFQDLDSRGVMLWSPPAMPHAGKIPVSARINYHYTMTDNSVTATASEIDTPGGGVHMDGSLGQHASSMNVVFDTPDLLPWDDFIDVLRGPDATEKISGHFHWQGRITGPLVGPTFTGHVKGDQAGYDRLYWDELEGDMVYSPDKFTLTRATARRGRSSAQLELALAFDNWSFDPDSIWSLDASLVRTDMDGLQELLGYSYPVHGVLTGDFHAKGTRENPQLTGVFDVIQPQAWNWRFDRAGGEITMNHDEIRISNAQLRLLPPPAVTGSQPAAPAGLLTGNFSYATANQQTAFDVTGASLPLEGVAELQTPRLPMGGRLSFQLSGEGPLFAPRMQSSMRLVDLKLGSEVLGSFDGKVASDGRQLTFKVDSAISTGELHGTVGVSLGGDYPLTGQFSIQQMDLDPLIISALHLDALTGHSSVDGQFALAGSLLRPDMLSVDATVSSIAFEYQHIGLQNVGPVRFEYGDHEVRVSQATFRAANNDFSLSGTANFLGLGALNLWLDGTVNLQLFGALVPNLEVNGPAQVNAGLGGTPSSPRLTGRVHVENAAMRYGDFPVGLSQVAGDFAFDASRLVFDNVTAQAGGGNLQLSGSVTYTGLPIRFDMTARTDQVRVRYAGMSWITGGTLRLLGTSQAATLSGRVTVDRLLLADNFDFASLVSTSPESIAAGGQTSEFLRNLQLDVQADASPNAALQWPSGTFQSDGTLRLRGTWQRPIVLGNVHLLSGQMSFRGNQYRLSRGDINFVNPFRLDPILNVEVVTTVQHYEILVDFTGNASHPVMSSRSDPPLPQSDIIALLAVGQTGQESQLRGGPAGGQTPTQGASTLLTQAFDSQLAGRIQRLFGISHFSVDPSSLAETSPGQNPIARVTVAEQFAHNLIITYSQDISSQQQQQIIQIEYTIRPDLSIVALRDENGTFGIDLVRRTRFK